MARKEASNLFGNEKDESFKSSLQSVVQTFGGQYV
jgi:predicted SpoU family rRNA methylase